MKGFQVANQHVRRIETLFFVAVLSAQCTPAAAADNEQLAVRIDNNLLEAVDVWWVAPGTSPNVFQGSLEPTEILSRNTYIGHEFVIHARGTNRVLKRFTVVDGLHTVHLNDNGSDQCEAFTHEQEPALPPCRDHPKAARKCASMGPDGVGCNSAPGWNIHFCPKTCDKALNGCYMHDPAIRCNRTRLFGDHDISTTPAFEPNSGAMQALFDSLEEKWAHLGARLVNSDPPIAVFDSFMSEEEALAVRTATGDNSFKLSTTSGSTDSTGYTTQTASKTRTSKNAWCMGGCTSNPVVKNITARISEVIMVDADNYESFQMLRYEPEQYYRRHHDNAHNPEKNTPAGPRIMTFFLYLSDVESGGETEFTELTPPLKVAPRTGRAVLWPSVKDDMVSLEPKTWHQANPVGPGGLKFAANAWVHLYNYRIPSLWGCTGSFTDP